MRDSCSAKHRLRLRWTLRCLTWLGVWQFATLACGQTALVPTQLSPAQATQPRIAQPRHAQFQDPESGETYVDADVFYAHPGMAQPGMVQPGMAYPGAAEYGMDGAGYDPSCVGDGCLNYDYIPADGVGYDDDSWSWQILPDGLIYRSYLAGVKEPRLGTQVFHLKDRGWLMDATIGGRVALLRNGTTNSLAPEGWELDVEAAAFPRIDVDRDWDMVSADWRAGVPLTYGRGKFQAKLAYYHLCSHLGDEEIIFLGSAASRINYVRDSVVLGLSYYVNPSLRLYSEAGWAFYTDGGAEPWEFQFGIDYSPIEPTGILGTPFLAVNAHLRQELDFSGNFVAQLGWQWRGNSGHLLRIGAHYYNGLSNQYQFFPVFEEQIGGGIWYDF